MLPLLLSGEAAVAAHRAMRVIATADGEIDPREAEFIDTVVRLETGAADQRPITPEEVLVALGELRAREVRTEIEALLTSGDGWIRAAAKGALADLRR